jgi:hypothetical protein
MKNSKIHLGICSFVIAGTVIIFSACRKNKTTTEDTSYATNQAVSEQTFTDVQTIADQASTITSGSLNYRIAATTGTGCASVTRSAGVININFGSSDCLCHDGRLRRGTIIVTYTGNYSDVGSVHTITFDNFYQNDNKVTGTKTVTNMGNNSLGQPCYNISINGAVTLSGGGTMSATWQRIRTWTAGYTTPDEPADDVFQVTGSGTMITVAGIFVNINISSPLTIANDCRWVEAGSVTYTLPGGATRVLNYGNSPVCDDLATLILANGTTKNIVLP